MKRCPKCNRTYQDDNQKFCTVDGGRLESAANAETQYDLGPTVLTNQADLNLPPENPSLPDLNKTMASMPPPATGEIRGGHTGPADNRTIITPYQPAESPQPPPKPQAYPPPPSPPQPQDYRPQPPPPAYQPQPPAYQQPPQQPQPPPQQQQYQQYQPQPARPSAPPPPPAHAAAPLQHPSGSAQQPAAEQRGAQPPAARKGSRLPLIIGLVVLLLLASGAAYYFLVLNKKSEPEANTNANVTTTNANANGNTNVSANSNTNANTNTVANANANTAPPFEPPPNTTEFTSSRENLSGKISEHFVPFSFYYPNSWDVNTSIAADGTYFVRVERKLPPDFTQERLAVGWYESNGTYEADKSLFPNLVEATSAKLEKLSGYEKLSEGPTKINSMDAYEFNFKGLTKNTEKGDITFWGRIVFLPPGVEGRKNGLQLTILTSSLAPELSGINDVGVKGELPVILKSFRLK